MNKHKNTNQNINKNSNKQVAVFSAKDTIEKRSQFDCLQTPPGDIPMRKPGERNRKG